MGTLREGKTEAKRADVVVLSGGRKDVSYDFDGPMFSTSTKEGKLVQISGEKVNIDAISKVVLLSGIANSDRFETMVSNSYSVEKHMKFNDHHLYTKNDVRKLIEIYNSFGAAVNAVITTEKDAARLLNSPLIDELKQTPVFYLPIQVEFGKSDKEAFDKMILRYGKHA